MICGTASRPLSGVAMKRLVSSGWLCCSAHPDSPDLHSEPVGRAIQDPCPLPSCISRPMDAACPRPVLADHATDICYPRCFRFPVWLSAKPRSNPAYPARTKRGFGRFADTRPARSEAWSQPCFQRSQTPAGKQYTVAPIIARLVIPILSVQGHVCK